MTSTACSELPLQCNCGPLRTFPGEKTTAGDYLIDSQCLAQGHPASDSQSKTPTQVLIKYEFLSISGTSSNLLGMLVTVSLLEEMLSSVLNYYVY